MSRLLLPQKLAAARLGVSLDQLRLLIDEKRLRFVQVGRSKLFAESELESFAQRETEKCQFIDEKITETGSCDSIGRTAPATKRPTRRMSGPSGNWRPWNEPSEQRESKKNEKRLHLVT